MISNVSVNTASRNISSAEDDDDNGEQYQSPIYRRSMTKKEAVMHTRVDMTGNIEYSARHKSSKFKVNHAPSLLGVEPSSSTGLASVEARLAELLAEHPDNERARELKHKIEVRKANNAAKQRHLHSLTTTSQSRTIKSAESLGSMSRLDIQALYGDPSPPPSAAAAATAATGTNPNHSGKRPETSRCRDVATTSSAPSSIRKIPMKNHTISKSSTSSEWANEMKKAKGDNYDQEKDETILDQDTASDRKNRSLLGLIQSIEGEYVSSKGKDEKVTTEDNDNVATPRKVKRKKSKKKTKMADSSGHNKSIASFESCFSPSSLDNSIEPANTKPFKKPYRKKESPTSQAAFGLNDSGTSFESNVSSSVGSMENICSATAMISSPTKQSCRKKSKTKAGTKRKSSKVSPGEIEGKPLDDQRENKTVRGDIECGKVEQSSTQVKPRPASHATMETTQVTSHDKTLGNKGRVTLSQPRRFRHRILVGLGVSVMTAGAVMLILWILHVAGVFQWLPTDGRSSTTNGSEVGPPSTSPAQMISSTTDGVGDQDENDNVFSSNIN